MIVKRREWLSEVAKEAILIVGDSGFECASFSHPCEIEVGATIDDPLFAINIKSLFLEPSDASLQISRVGDSLEHKVVARVVDVESSTVSVGSLIIELDEALPGDVSANDIVSFSCGRLDVI